MKSRTLCVLAIFSFFLLNSCLSSLLGDLDQPDGVVYAYVYTETSNFVFMQKYTRNKTETINTNFIFDPYSLEWASLTSKGYTNWYVVYISMYEIALPLKFNWGYGVAGGPVNLVNSSFIELSDLTDFYDVRYFNYALVISNNVKYKGFPKFGLVERY
ncbi:MAG: hypothetical protein A2014_12460 [Spirochaetes bacterium GWF1_49_6]|nr:MAG: hypothetical protein A2014_12460 [Spirochaetes bacterium GWF1_49_6]